VADVGTDVFHYADLNVQPGDVHRYRVQPLYSVEPRVESPNFIEAEGSASDLPGGVPGGIVLTATGFAAGSDPDRFSLDWNTLPNNNTYIVLRTDPGAGLKRKTFLVLATLGNTGHYDDFVEPGNGFTYRVLAVDATTGALVGTSNVAEARTPSGTPGTDVALSEFTLPSAPQSNLPFGTVTVFNASDDVLHGYRVRVGVEWWVLPQGTATVPTRVVSFHADGSDDSSPPLFEQEFQTDLLPQTGAVEPIGPFPIPVWGQPFGTLAGWWVVRVEPLDDSGNTLSDASPEDNELTSSDPAIRGSNGVIGKPR
jgi:hypothetical protein